MANTSILAAFERMWQHVVIALNGKSDLNHNHDDKYYTESEIDIKFSDINNTYETKDDAEDRLKDAKDYSDIKLMAEVSARESGDTNVLRDAKAYTDTQIAAIPTPDVSGQINGHNVDTTAHNDIRDLISGLTTRLNALANSTDKDLDQMAEIVDYIKSNKSLIDSITTSKVSASDIVNNLTTNVTNKPLSAAQGVAIKALIDALEDVVDGKADEEHSHAIADVTNLQSSLDAKVPTSRKVNGKALSADITLSASDVSAYSKTEVDNKLSGKADSSHGNHVPATQTASNKTFLRNDNTWATVTPANIGAAASSHNHTVSNITDLTATATELNYMDGVTSNVQTQLDGKADSSHGTHVTWSTTSPKANGTATVGSETKVARGDHIHPTDTTRAAASDLTSHTGNTTVHITSTERTNWGAAYTHSTSTHARTDATKVEASSTNGKIKINGTETTVYTHPTGTNPHSTTKSDVGLGNVENKSSATIRGELTKSNVTTALGYTPYTQAEVNNLLADVLIIDSFDSSTGTLNTKSFS